MRHKCLAVFIVIILYFSVTSLIVLAEIRTLVKADTITTILAKSGIYGKLPQYAEAIFSTGNLQTKILGRSISEALEPKFVQSEVEKDLGLFLKYLNGNGPVPNIGFDMVPIKTKLKTTIPDVTLEEIKNLPSCEGDTSQDENGILTCRPTSASDAQLMATLNNANSTQDLINQIPDTFGLQQIKNPDQVFHRAILAFKIINYGFWISLIVSLLMIFFLVLLGRSWWPSILRWTGWGLFLPAVSMLLFTFISLAIPKILLVKYGSQIDPEVIKMINPVIDALNQASKSISLLYSGIITGLGFVLLLLSYVIPHPPEPARNSTNSDVGGPKPAPAAPSPQPVTK